MAHSTSIRQQNASVVLRVDATASRVQSAVTTKKVSKSMEVKAFIEVFKWRNWIWQGVVKGMSAAMKSMNLEKISTLMDNFEKEFEVVVYFEMDT